LRLPPSFSYLGGRLFSRTSRRFFCRTGDQLGCGESVGYVIDADLGLLATLRTLDEDDESLYSGDAIPTSTHFSDFDVVLLADFNGLRPE